MNTKISMTCNSFDILNLPVEIDTNFSFNKEELESLDVGFLNTELINNEHFCTKSNENLVFDSNLFHIESDTDTKFQRLTKISITPEILPNLINLLLRVIIQNIVTFSAKILFVH